MRFFGLLILCLTLPVLAGSEIKTQIHDVDYGKKGEDVLILLTSGHVAKLRPEDKRFLEIVSIKNQNGWFNFTLDDDRYITQVEPSQSPIDEIDYSLSQSSEKETYIPTTIASMDVAKSYFKTARRTHKEETQCFNRAMIWTYEWWKKHSLKSNKLLVFFTRNYIRRYNFEWWFHIAPYVHILHEGKVVERVMDVKYSSGPRTFREWTNIFMNKDPECPVITRYSDYADHPYVGECYIMRTHMYTYQPADLQMYEAWGYKKNAFNLQEVKGAYLEAYDIEL